MNKLLITLFSVLTLTGCLGSNSTENTAETDMSYYVVDLKKYTFCRGMSDVCQNLNNVISHTHQVSAIEDTYEQEIKGPNHRASLIRMILSPTDNSYASELISKDGRYRKVPINNKTDVVWYTLAEIQKEKDKRF